MCQDDAALGLCPGSELSVVPLTDPLRGSVNGFGGLGFGERRGSVGSRRWRGEEWVDRAAAWVGLSGGMRAAVGWEWKIRGWV